MSFPGTLVLLTSITIMTSAAAAQDVFIAGINPGERPASAPRITAFEKTPEWTANALHGLSEPYPPSLRFLDDQGAWFTPFIHAGMTGHYDIRGWHKGE